MKNSEYWKERFEQLNEALLNQGETYYASLDKEYRKAMKEIEIQINNWYARIAKNNGINMIQAKKWIKGKELEEFKWTVEEYIQYGKDNALGQAWMKELENASARVHIRRLEALEIQLRQTIESLYQKQYEGLTDVLKSIYEDGYYHSAFEIQRGFNVGWTIPALDERRVAKVLSKPWTTDNSTFSSSIWNARDDMINFLHTKLTQSLIMGKAPDKLISEIARKFGNTKKKGARFRAGRLVMTESAFFASASQRDCFNDLDVEQYKISATLDLRTSEICQDMDGKLSKMSEYEPGITAPPFHCWCRTTTVPYFEDNYGERIARDESGRQFYVPNNMTYKEWKKEYIKDPKLNEEIGLKKSLENQLSKLTTEEKDVLTRYTGYLANNVNSALGTRNIERIKKYANDIRLLDSALAKGVIPEDITVIRKTILNDMRIPKGMDLTDERLVGYTVNNDAFISTALNEFYYPGRDVYMSLKVPKGYQGALYIKPLAHKKYKHQEEVLFHRGLKYRINHASMEEGIYYVEAEVIP